MLAASLGLPVVATMAPAASQSERAGSAGYGDVVIDRQSAARGDGQIAIAPRITVERDGCARLMSLLPRC